MKRITNSSRKVWKAVLGFLGIFLGFSSVVAAQYGVMETQFIFKGNLLDLCEQPVQDAKVKLEIESPWDQQRYVVSEMVTDSNGYFAFYIHDHYALDNVMIYAHLPQGADQSLRRDTVYVIPSDKLVFKSAQRGSWHTQFELQDPVRLIVNYSDGRKCREEDIVPVAEEIPVEDTAVVAAPIIVEDLPDEDVMAAASDTVIETSELGQGDVSDPSGYDVRIYPNPTVDRFYMEIDVYSAVALTMQLFDASMNLVWERQRALEPGLRQEPIDMGSFAPGVYFLHISGLDRAKVFRVVKAAH